LLVVLTAMLAVGVGTALAAVTVAYRDFRYVVPFVLQIWMFASPVAYPASLLPERWRWLSVVNPAFGVVEAYRAALFGTAMPWQALGYSTLFGIVLLFAAVSYFRSVERRFADII